MRPHDLPAEADAIRAMKAAPMFSKVQEASVQGLLRRCSPRRYGAGEAVFEAGEKADRFFVVIAGRVKISQLSPKGDEQILHLYGPGSTFGEAAMWEGLDYPAHATAAASSVLLPVPYAALRAALAQDPDLVMGMIAGISAKLREFAHLIEQLSLKEVPARLAGVLLAQARLHGSNTFRLKQSKKELAAQIGTIPETLSRALLKLKTARLVDVRGSTLLLRDPEKLRALAENG